MDLFDALVASGRLTPIDLGFASLVRRRATGPGADLVAVAAALASLQRGSGHSCIDLAEWASRPFPDEGAGAVLTLPERAVWESALASSPLVGTGAEPTPLVRDAAGRLYLRRYWQAEQRVARRLRERLASPPPDADLAALAPLFGRLFPPPATAPLPARDGHDRRGQPDWQGVAAAVALRSSVALVSGGPGTGKTTTVARLLALLVAAAGNLRVALAAPTGKAAARLGEALAAQLPELPLAPEARAQLPHQAATLHRLLGYLPRQDRFRHDASRPLAVDVLVIDEASMIDLLLMDAVLAALPAAARLILLGDRDQLASVETGFVFGDLCLAAGLDGATAGYSQGFAAAYQTLSGRDLPPAAVAAGGRGAQPLADAGVELRVSYRFRQHPGIGELAQAIRGQDADRALTLLESSAYPEVERLAPPATVQEALSSLVEPLAAYLSSATPVEALARLGRFRILCATRLGPWGVERLNAAVERHLTLAGHPVTERWYRGRPILVTANDYHVQLFNGDLGVCWPDAGRLFAWFASEDGARRVPLARLPAHDTAWAMTVHKSQGSEFDRVLLALGSEPARAANRELLYTGVTRARQSVVLVATPEVVRHAIAQRAQRASGLVGALGGDAPAPAPEVAAAPPAAGSPVQLSLFGP